MELSYKSILFLFFLISNCFGEINKENVMPLPYHKNIGVPLAKELLDYELGQNFRIIGGSPASLGQYPFQAGLLITLTTGWQSICGGSLVSNTKVLSAAHCWYDGESQGRAMTVVLGSTTIFSGGTRINNTRVNNHPNWNPETITFDISIITIDRVTFNNNINVVALPSLSEVNQNFAGLTGVASGFGKTTDAQTSFPTSTSLQHVSLSIITNAECQKSFDFSIHDSHLCTSGNRNIGTCEGDSGGPLSVVFNTRRVIVGIASFGLGSGCERGYPSVFSRVTAFLTWINANL